MNRPKIDNAPGLSWRRCVEGWEARWRPRSDIAAKGCPVKLMSLWKGMEPTDGERKWIADQCRTQQDAMLAWARGGIPEEIDFDGTIGSLIECYQQDPDSGFRKLQFKTREVYTNLLRRLDRDHGDMMIADIRARQLMRWHEDWMKGSGVSMAHSLVGMLRTLGTFGATLLEDDACRDLKVILHDMKFKNSKPRTERLTADYAEAVRAEAHRKGLHSIALAQAFQFECMLRQKDVIGEWLPIGEPGVSDVLHGRLKWLKGLRWEEISDDLILTHTTSKRQKDIEIDLKNAPMVMEELKRLPKIPASGPVVVSDLNGRPWAAYEFRRQWRKLADAAGVPKTVLNMDSRAGAISEATDAGADLEHVRHAATHGDIAMTQRYSRNSTEKIASVQAKRTAHRNKTGTEQK